MHIDSHRLRFHPQPNSSIPWPTVTMPCPRRFAAALQETETTEDGIKMYTWRAVRRQHLQMLRKQTRVIVFFMALIEILRVGAVDMVYRGKHDTLAPGPEDFGVCYDVYEDKRVNANAGNRSRIMLATSSRGYICASLLCSGCRSFRYVKATPTTLLEA